MADNWLDLLGDNPRVPADVHIKVVEKIVVEGHIDTSRLVLRAHKLVLAMYSDVFKAQFYGPMGHAEEEVLVEETSIAAFKEFLGILYSRHLHEHYRIITTIRDVELLYEILNLAKRYLVVGEAILFLEETIANMSPSAVEVIPAAIIAHRYHRLEGFETISDRLLRKCSAALNVRLNTLEKKREFVAMVESEYSGDDLKLILRLIAGTDPASSSGS